MTRLIISRMIRIYTACHSALDFWLISLYATMDVSKSQRWESPKQDLRGKRVNYFIFSMKKKIDCLVPSKVLSGDWNTRKSLRGQRWYRPQTLSIRRQLSEASLGWRRHLVWRSTAVMQLEKASTINEFKAVYSLPQNIRAVNHFSEWQSFYIVPKN